VAFASLPLARLPPESWHMRRDSVVHLDSIGAEVRIDVHLDVSESRGSRDDSSSSPASTPLERLLHPGRIVGGRYELVRLLGQGSMGAVWLATHTTLGERVALKVLATAADANAAEDASTCAARFRFEAQIAARLSRKTRHVVRVTDHGYDGHRPYLVMELLEGQTLEKALVCRGPLGLAEACALVSQIARGLEAAHAEGILHRDLKPANVFLADGGEGRPLVKLLDFGVARAQRLGAPFATAKGVIVGTPGYMSPEQASGVEIDARSDLWSLAAIAYEVLTGELPVAGIDAEQMLSNLRACQTVPLRHRRPDASDAMGGFFQRAFAPRIDERYGTCAELAVAFEQATRLGAGGTRRLVAPLGLGANVGRPGAMRKYAPPILAVALLATGLLGLWYASASWRSPVPSRERATMGMRRAPSPVEAARSTAMPDGPSSAPSAARSPASATTGTSESVGTGRPAGSGAAGAPVVQAPASKTAPAARSSDLGEFKANY
jgi:serine/threonine-protein kinase